MQQDFLKFKTQDMCHTEAAGKVKDALTASVCGRCPLKAHCLISYNTLIDIVAQVFRHLAPYTSTHGFLSSPDLCNIISLSPDFCPAFLCLFWYLPFFLLVLYM
jgi:hypothetical protein